MHLPKSLAIALRSYLPTEIFKNNIEFRVWINACIHMKHIFAHAPIAVKLCYKTGVPLLSGSVRQEVALSTRQPLICGFIDAIFFIDEIAIRTQIAKFMGPTWGPPGSCRPQMGPLLVPWTLLSGYICRYTAWRLHLPRDWGIRGFMNGAFSAFEND